MVIILNDFILVNFITWIFILCRLISLIWNHPKQLGRNTTRSIPQLRHETPGKSQSHVLEVGGGRPVGVFIGHS